MSKPALYARSRLAGALFPPQAQPQHSAQLQEQLHQSPALWGLERSRWTLKLLQEHCPLLQELHTLSGVWRRLKKWQITRQRSRSFITSPDPAYRHKLALIEGLLQEAITQSNWVVLYGDEHTFYRQPLAGLSYHRQGGGGRAQPRAYRSHKSDTKRRIAGALNALTGQVSYRCASKMGAKELARWMHQLRQEHGPQARIFLIWDNWPVHYHWRVLEAAAQAGIELLWLPTYAPWTNPIEKLWRKLHEEVLCLHRLADQWEQLKAQVENFLSNLNQPSPYLLHYVGLLPN
jgi:hypothetical protein